MKRSASNEPEGAASGKRARKSQSMVDLVYENIIKNKCLRLSSFRMGDFVEWGARLAKEAHVLDVCRSHDFDGSMAEYARDEALELASDADVNDFDIINAFCTTLPKMGLDATMRDILRESDLVYRDLMIEHSEYEHEHRRALNHKFLLAIARAWEVSTNRGEMVNELTTYYTLRCLAEKVEVIDIPYLEHEENYEIPKMWAIEQFFHLLQEHEKDMDPLFRLVYSISSGPMKWSGSMDKDNEPSFSSWQLSKVDILGDVPTSDQESSASEDEDESSETPEKEEGEVVLETEEAEDETMIEQLREKGTLGETVKNQIKERFPENLRFSESMPWWTKIAWLYE